MPLPPEPVLVNLNVPPAILMFASDFMQAEALVFCLSESHSPPPVVSTVMLAVLSALAVILLSALMPLAAVPVTLMYVVPPSSITSPLFSSVSSSVLLTWMPSSPTPVMFSVPPFCRKYWLMFMPSPTALVILMVPSFFFSSTYSSPQKACFVLPTIVSVPAPLNSECPLTMKAALWLPLAPSAK